MYTLNWLALPSSHSKNTPFPIPCYGYKHRGHEHLDSPFLPSTQTTPSFSPPVTKYKHRGHELLYLKYALNCIVIRKPQNSGAAEYLMNTWREALPAWPGTMHTWEPLINPWTGNEGPRLQCGRERESDKTVWLGYWSWEYIQFTERHIIDIVWYMMVQREGKRGEEWKGKPDWLIDGRTILPNGLKTAWLECWSSDMFAAPKDI